MDQIPQEHLKLFKTVSKAAKLCNQPVYVIGGYVRDYLLERKSSANFADIDFVTVGSGIKLAQQVAELLEIDRVNTFKKFGTAHLRFNSFDLEFVGARTESYREDSRKPAVEEGSLEDDQRRRDFTINALSFSLNEENFGELVDPFDGLKDLKAGLIRTPIDAAQTFSDDPLRMMRAIRFATELDFSIAPKTYAGILESADRISIISQERITEELNKILSAPIPSKGFVYLFNTGLLNHIIPELVNLHGVEIREGVGHKDNFWHTLQVLDNVAEVSDDLWLRWAALLHDIAKPPTKRFVRGIGWTFHGHDALGSKWVKKIFRRLSLPMDDRMRYVQKLVRLHLRPIALVDEEVTDSAIRRLIVESGEDLEDLMTLCRADITSRNDKKVRRFLKNFDLVEKKVHQVAEKDRLRNWQPPIDGKEIMQTLNLTEGPAVGKIKKAIEQAILDGKIPNEHDAAHEYMLQIKDEYLDHESS